MGRPLRRVYDTHRKLYQTELVKGKVTQQTVNEFVRILNIAMPNRASERDTQSLIRRFYYHDKQGYIKSLIKTGNRHLILWTDANAIIAEYKIQGVILRWKGDRFKGIIKREKTAYMPVTKSISVIPQKIISDSETGKSTEQWADSTHD